MFEYLGDLCKGLVAPRGFSPLGPVSERHGSWEWACHKHAGLDRFVIVALTSLPPQIGVEFTPYSIEVVAGAEDGDRFVRRLVRESRFLDQGKSTDPFYTWLKDSLNEAMELAEKIKPADVVEAYSSRRSLRL